MIFKINGIVDLKANSTKQNRAMQKHYLLALEAQFSSMCCCQRIDYLLDTLVLKRVRHWTRPFQ